MGKIKHIRHAAAFCPSARSVFRLLLYAVTLPMPAGKAAFFHGCLRSGGIRYILCPWADTA